MEENTRKEKDKRDKRKYFFIWWAKKHWNSKNKREYKRNNFNTKKEDKRIFTPKLTIDILQNKATIKAVATPSKSSKKQRKQKTGYSKCDTCYDKFDFKIGALLSVSKVLGFDKEFTDYLADLLTDYIIQR